MKNPIMYVVLNGELKMSPGKAAAQAVHSAMLLNGNSKEDFLSDFRRTVIVLEAKNAMQLQNLAIYLDGAEIDSDYYIDEGVNEVDAYSITALAAFVGDNEELRQVFEAFPLYNGHVTVKHVDTALGIDVGTKEKIIIPGNLKVESGFVFRGLKKAARESL
jgi:peptidyl-tRNA hydrolase